MVFTNNQIFILVSNIAVAFGEKEIDNLQLPILVNYKLQYNFQHLLEQYNLIQLMRTKIGKKYGTLIEDGTYQLSPENITIAAEAMNSILEETIDVPIKQIKLSELVNINLSFAQMQALYPMIEDDITEKKEVPHYGTAQNDDKP